MKDKDIRWQQRLINFRKALNQFKRFLEKEELNEMEKQGLIKAFEYTYELAWKTMQDLLGEKGYKNVIGPKPVIEQSFADGFITDGKAWMRMHNSRNLTSHTYDELTAEEIIKGIRAEYFDLLNDIYLKLEHERTCKPPILFND